MFSKNTTALRVLDRNYNRMQLLTIVNHFSFYLTFCYIIQYFYIFCLLVLNIYLTFAPQSTTS